MDAVSLQHFIFPSYMFGEMQIYKKRRPQNPEIQKFGSNIDQYLGCYFNIENDMKNMTNQQDI